MRSAALFIVGAYALLGLAGCAERDPLDQADELISRKRYGHAIVVYDRILAENPDSVAALIGRGRAYAASAKPELAIEDFSRALLLDPKRSEAFYRRALAYESLGDLAAAEADRHSAHAVDPTYRQAFAGAGRSSLPASDLDDEEEFDVTSSSDDTASARQSNVASSPAEDDRELVWFNPAHTPFPSAFADVDDPDIPLSRTDRRAASYLTLDGAPEFRPGDSVGGRFPAPFWLRPDTALPFTRPAIKPSANASPTVSRPVPLANPYVRAPVPPSTKGTAPGPVTQATARPAALFPQAPLPSTGRQP